MAVAPTETRKDGRSRAVRTGSRQRGAGTKGRREVDTDRGPGAASPAGDGVAGVDRSCAPVGMGTVRGRSEPGRSGADEALDGCGAEAAGLREYSEAGRGAEAARVRLGWQ